jgi:hypothetical protein
MSGSVLLALPLNKDTKIATPIKNADEKNAMCIPCTNGVVNEDERPPILLPKNIAIAVELGIESETTVSTTTKLSVIPMLLSVLFIPETTPYFSFGALPIIALTFDG